MKAYFQLMRLLLERGLQKNHPDFTNKPNCCKLPFTQMNTYKASGMAAGGW